MKDIIQSISPSLKEVYNEYKDQGIQAVYLWGSAITEDFDPQTSDIDSIAIVSEDFSPKLEDIIKQQLQSKHPSLKKFGFRILYEEELRSGSPTKSTLAAFIPPRLLLFDLPNWLHVGGRVFSQGDFTNELITPTEAIKLRLFQLKNRNLENAADVPIGEEEFYLKKLWRMIHLLQLVRGLEGKFSYSFVKSNMNEEEGKLVEVLEELKQSKYNRDLFVKYIPLFNSFVKGIKLRFIN